MNAAFYHAENALEWAAQSIADQTPSATSNLYSIAGGTLTLPYASSAGSNSSDGFRGAWVKIMRQ